MESIRRLADSGKGVISVMHELPMALAFSDIVIVLKEGQMRFFGTPEELLKTDIIKKVFGISIVHENGDYFYRISASKNERNKV